MMIKGGDKYKFTYRVMFKNKYEFFFNSDIDIDLHKLQPGYLALDDLFIDLNDVLYIRKEIYREKY